MALLRARLPQLVDAWQQHTTTTTTATTTTTTGRLGGTRASTAPQGKHGSGAGGDGGGGGESLADPGFTCRHPDCTYASTRQVSSQR